MVTWAARHVVNTPDVPQIGDGWKDALRPIVTSRPLITVLIFLALMGIAASGKMPKMLRVGAIVFVALAVYGWVDHSGVALAAAGGKQENADTATVTAAIVGGGYLLMKVIPGLHSAPMKALGHSGRGWFRRKRGL
jgi:hypothetical protein